MKNTKLYFLTGFLGSGKTTILLRLIEELKGKKVGIIQNEFGKLGIDGEILRDDDVQMVEINRGSIFCSCLKLSFVGALKDMAEHDFDYLFVESSGLGDPSNVEEILDVVEKVAQKTYDFEGVVCMVDAVNFLEQLEDLETVNRQLKHCNLAILTKTDLVDEEQLEKVKEKVREINPVCKMQESVNADMDYDFLEEDLSAYRWAEGEETTNSEEAKPKTLFLDIQEPVDRAELTKFLEEVLSDAYRIKGFVEIDGSLEQVDVVGKKIDFKPARNGEKSEIVVISKVGPAIIKTLFNAWEKNVSTKMKIRN